MTKVRITLMKGKRGDYHDRVECALRSDGTSPANDFWNELKSGVWQNGRTAHVDPSSEEQIDMFFVLARVMRKLIETGRPPYRTSVNDLQDGIWEIKGGKARIPYFDVDPRSGGHEPKPRIEDIALTDPNFRNGYWWYPKMDRTIRLTHGFLKTGITTEDEDLILAEVIRREDLE